MNRLPGLLALAVLLHVPTRAEDLYRLRPLSERELAQTYTDLMRDACRHADQFWHDAADDPRAGYWGSGRSDNMNEGIRAISGMVLTCSTLLKYSDALKGAERERRLGQTSRAIRYTVSSHRTGVLKCTDGKPWGGTGNPRCGPRR